jgi:hypothetical protein
MQLGVADLTQGSSTFPLGIRTPSQELGALTKELASQLLVISLARILPEPSK